MRIVRCALVVAAALAAPLLSAGAGDAATVGAAVPLAAKSPIVVDGTTTQLGGCDSLEAVIAQPTTAFACLGSADTDLAALRAAYQSGGMRASSCAETTPTSPSPRTAPWGRH